jgi:hypothetical protein
MLVIIMDEEFRKLAERNGWSYSLIDNRPYFMNNGKYAVPDETTSEEDKELLANIISEGSQELAQLIKLCWNNGIVISGPCSGIREFHDNPPFALHFGFKAQKDIIEPLYNSLQVLLPELNHMCREEKDLIRYDITYPLIGDELSIEQSNEIFSIIKNQLQIELDNLITKKR